MPAQTIVRIARDQLRPWKRWNDNLKKCKIIVDIKESKVAFINEERGDHEPGSGF